MAHPPMACCNAFCVHGCSIGDVPSEGANKDEKNARHRGRTNFVQMFSCFVLACLRHNLKKEQFIKIQKQLWKVRGMASIQTRKAYDCRRDLQECLPRACRLTSDFLDSMMLGESSPVYHIVFNNLSNSMVWPLAASLCQNYSKIQKAM
jgi:hypothetical protein